MYVLATDDEQQSLERLIHILKEFLPAADIHGFKSSKEALSFAEDVYKRQGIDPSHIQSAFLGPGAVGRPHSHKKQ